MLPAMNTLIDTNTGKAITLAMQKLDVSGRVYPIGSFVRVTHRFRCLGSRPMEAIYVAALPTGGVMRRFKVVGENFEVDSKLEPRKKARAEYEKGVSEGHLSVLAETNRDGLVHLSVGQVQPDEEISVILDVVVGVTTRDQGFQFRYPFTLAPNYHPQAKMSATADGGKIELPDDVFGDMVLPEWKTSAFGLHEVSFNLQVCSGTNLMGVASPSHRVSVTPQVDGSMMVTLAGMGDTPNRDLVLDIAMPAALPILFNDATATISAGLPSGAGRWTALIPSTMFTKGARVPRKVCFLIDRSGSMTGSRNHDPKAPILGAKQALLACLSALQPDDEFGIVHFGSDAVAFHPTLAKADDANRKKAAAWVEKIQCNGGTEMLQALGAATSVLGGPGDVFVLTDGEVSETGPIVEHMAEAKCRVHVLGIGTASQHRFMAQLARRTNGACEMVSPTGDVGITGLKLFNQVKDPVLSNPTVLVDGQAVPDMGVVWDGYPLLVTDPTGTGANAISVNGQVFDRTVFATVAVPDGLTALLWAGRKIEDLSSKMDMAQPNTPKWVILEKEMTDVSVGYGLASRVMSLVAVVERVGDAAGVTPEQKLVAVGLPEGMDPGFFGSRAQTYSSSHLNFAGGGQVRSRGLQFDMARDSYIDDNTRSRSAYSSSPRLTKSAPSGGMLYSASVGSTSVPDFDQERGRDIYSPELDVTRGFGVVDTIADISAYDPNVVAVAAAACGPTGFVEVDDFRPSANLLGNLGTLKADGGVPGLSLSERVLNTILLALITALESQTVPGVYDTHIARMRAFIDANSAVLNDRISVHKAMSAVVRPSACRISRAELGRMFHTSAADVLLAFRSIV